MFGRNGQPHCFIHEQIYVIWSQHLLNPLMNARYLPFLLILLAACQNPDDPQHIINQAIETHGGRRYENCLITFAFRQYNVRLEHRSGQFRYERAYADSAGRAIREVLSNEGLRREIDGKPQQLSEKEYNRYLEGVNSIAYFVLLPYKLNDPAAIKTFIGKTELEGQPYHKIRVSFRKEGGGKDYQDVFCYWIHRNRHTMDYLAYSQGGPRFRKVVRVQEVGGIRFQDYLNYQGDKNDTTAVTEYDRKFSRDEFSLLSRIEQRNIQVE